MESYVSLVTLCCMASRNLLRASNGMHLPSLGHGSMACIRGWQGMVALAGGGSIGGANKGVFFI